MSSTFTIQRRSRRLVNTDPQRRCYNGCHFSTGLVWTEWEDLEIGVPEDRVELRLEFWKSLNDIAVDGRGESARREFRSVENRQEDKDHD